MRLSANLLINLTLASCLLYQCLFHAFVELNVLCVVMVATVSFVCRGYALDTNQFEKSPLHSLVIVAFDITSLSGPLLLKTFSLQPITEQLNVPIRTFASASLSLLIVTATLLAYNAHHLRTALSAVSNKRFMVALNFYRPLDSRQIMGVFTVGSVIYFLFAATGSNVLSKLGDAFGLFISAPPLIIYFSSLTKSNSKRVLKIVLIYFLFLLILGMAGNARETFVTGVAVAVICGIVAAKNVQIVMSSRLLIRILFALTAVFIMISAFERLSLAMLVTRAFRATSTPTEMISLTTSAFFDNRLLDNYRDYEILSDNGDYSESYVQGRLLSRLVTTKFQDNILFFGGMLSQTDMKTVIDYEKSSILSLLPQPTLDFLSLHVDKVDRYTLMDLLGNLTTGLPLGGYRSGSLVGDVWLIFGFVSPLIIVLIALTMFSLIDFCIIRGPTYTYVSPLLLLISWKLLGTLGAWGLNADSLSAWGSVPLRQFPQAVIAYILVANFVLWLLPSRDFYIENSN